MSFDAKTRNAASWVEAFTIFAKYFDDDELFEVAPSHDLIYAGPSPEVVTEEDILRLGTLGWHPDREFECFRRHT